MTLRRLRWIATSGAAVMLVLAVVTTLTVHGSAQQTASGMVPAPLATGNPVEATKPLPRIPLVNEYGQATSLSAFKGKWVIFAPSMTLCHETCPMTTGVLMELTQMVRRAGLSSQVVIAEVTVDPWQDSPAQMRAYKRMTGADFTMLTGKVANVLRLWKMLGILVERVPLEKPVPIDWFTHKPETMNIVHSDGLFILDPAGAERVVVGGMPQLAHGHKLESALYKLLDSEGKHNLHDPEAPWTASQLLDDLDWGMGREVPASSLSHPKPPSPETAQRELSGSPTSLASLHTQAGQLLGSINALKQRLASLHGYPIVLNVWASWCPPCRAEFPLFASASSTFGRKVAFLGFDANDQPANARSFLKSHPVSYPSYQGTSTALSSIAPIEGTPTTIYIDAQGKVLYVRTGQYETEGTLDSDIERYALGEHRLVTGHKTSSTKTSNTTH